MPSDGDFRLVVLHGAVELVEGSIPRVGAAQRDPLRWVHDHLAMAQTRSDNAIILHGARNVAVRADLEQPRGGLALLGGGGLRRRAGAHDLHGPCRRGQQPTESGRHQASRDAGHIEGAMYQCVWPVCASVYQWVWRKDKES